VRGAAIFWFSRRLDASGERWVFPESAIGLARLIDTFSIGIRTANIIEKAGEPFFNSNNTTTNCNPTDSIGLLFTPVQML
jgi:hypothetical protein